MSLIVDGTTGVTFNDSSLQGAAASPYVLKNRIINGAMEIDQRNAGASVTPTVNDTYVIDRFAASISQASKYSMQQNAGSVTPPTGFKSYLGITVTSAYSVGAGDFFGFLQYIEGNNIADFSWGTASASSITLSFWVRSSVTGTYSVKIGGASSTRSYVSTYTINAANTWEYKTISLTGATTGTWLTNNGAGIQLYFSLGMGSNFNASSTNTWLNGDVYQASTQTQWIANAGATFYITGVQLEIGTSATPFERRMYGQELINCQRYYEKSYDQATTAGTITGNGVVWNYVITSTGTVGDLGTTAQFKVDKRTAPTMVWYSPDTGASGVVGSAGGDKTAISQYVGQHSAAVYATVSNSNGQVRVHYTATAEL